MRLFADIHAHILPGMDDGAADMDESVEMLRMAVADGTAHIVVTPHFTPACYAHGQDNEISGGATIDCSGVKNVSDIVRQRAADLRDAAIKNGIDVSVYTGTEALLTPETPELLDCGSICTINDSSYVLVEFPSCRIPVYASEVLYRIQLSGFVPVIAHPERCFEVIRDHRVLKDFIERDILLQVNSGSLTGMFGKKIKRTAMKLIKSGMIHFVASDAHSCNGRKPVLSKAAAIVEKKFGREAAERLFYSNGLAMLQNGTVLPAVVRRDRPGFFKRLYRRLAGKSLAGEA